MVDYFAVVIKSIGELLSRNKRTRHERCSLVSWLLTEENSIKLLGF